MLAAPVRQIKRVQLHVGVGQKKPHISDRANSRALTEILKKMEMDKSKRVKTTEDTGDTGHKRSE